MDNPTTLAQNSKTRLFIVKVVASIALIGTFAIVGLGLGAWLGYQKSFEPPPWQSLGKPPQPATKILFADVTTVYVQTATEQIYQCCWKLGQMPATPGITNNCTPPPVQPLPLPAPVVDQRVASKCLGEFFDYQIYAVLNDGSVWRWQFSPAPMIGFFGLVFGGALGLCGGWIIGLIPVVILWIIVR